MYGIAQLFDLNNWCKSADWYSFQFCPQRSLTCIARCASENSSSKSRFLLFVGTLETAKKRKKTFRYKLGNNWKLVGNGFSTELLHFCCYMYLLQAWLCIQEWKFTAHMYLSPVIWECHPHVVDNKSYVVSKSFLLNLLKTFSRSWESLTFQHESFDTKRLHQQLIHSFRHHTDASFRLLE